MQTTTTDRVLRVAYYDAGACVGTTVAAVNNTRMSLGVQRKIYAIEPFPGSVAKLRKLKATSIPDMVIVHAAVGLESGESRLYLCHSDQGHSIHSTKGNVDLKKVVPIQVVRFSDILSRTFESFDLHILKLNVEGAEFEVITDLYRSGMYKKLSAIIFASSKKGPYPVDLDKIKLPEKHIRRTLTKLSRFSEAGVKVIAYPDTGQFAHAVSGIVGTIVKEHVENV